MFSEVAEKIELCLFDGPGDTAESERIALPGSTGGVHHGYFPDLRPGQLYGLRAHGPGSNPAKLVFDPCARAAGREMQQEDSSTPLSCLGVLLAGAEIGDLDDDGNRSPVAAFCSC